MSLRSLRKRHFLIIGFLSLLSSTSYVLFHLWARRRDKDHTVIRTSKACAPVLLNFPRTGRLGNQMFNYASLKGISTRSGKPAQLPNDEPFLPSRAFDLPEGSLDFVPFDSPDVDHFVEEAASGFYHRATERLSCSAFTVLEGWFQSWRYFDNIKAEIRSSFTSFAAPVRAECDERWAGLGLPAGALPVGVHVRRGDFLDPYNREYGFLAVDAAYLMRAVVHFQKRFAKRQLRFLILGQDPAWNRNNTPNGEMFHRLEKSEDPAVDLCLLSRCSHTIISTGTFGWWAAWLAGGEVVRPAVFARPNSSYAARVNPEDHFPHGWLAV